MGSEWEKERRLAALCKRMGDMWYEEIVVNVFEKMPEEKIQLCNLTILGKLYSRPNVNYQAFTSTMKKAWKVDNVVCDSLEGGLFSFTFTSEIEKDRVLEASPWSFSNNLLILQQLNPKEPIHRHNFTHCAFWVQIIGLPLAMITEQMLCQIGSNMGEVVETKMDARGGSICKVGKVRVRINLTKPLKSGMVINTEEDQMWVDFRYERLPLYCYSCGKIGHFTTKCETFPYKEEEQEPLYQKNFGYWLRAEARQLSPFWKIFNEGDFQDEVEEESVPETQLHPETYADTLVMEQDIQPLQQKMPALESLKRKGKMTDDDLVLKSSSGQGKQLLIMGTPWNDEPAASTEKSVQQKGRYAGSKRMKKCNQITSVTDSGMLIDETQLCETPIRFEKMNEIRALVAGPNKPLGIR